MRCWQCKKLIIVPEREMTDAKLFSQSHTTEVTCNSCGCMYTITTTKLPGRMVKTNKTEDEEGSRGWR